jgi:hypothetical protein
MLSAFSLIRSVKWVLKSCTNVEIVYFVKNLCWYYDWYDLLLQIGYGYIKNIATRAKQSVRHEPDQCISSVKYTSVDKTLIPWNIT